MIITRVRAVYFSGTGTTRTVTERVGRRLAEALGASYSVYSFTLPSAREAAPSFSASELVVFGLPVYAGRVPNLLLPYLRTLKGNGAAAIPIVLYGNRNYDDALIELSGLLEADGFHTAAAGAFIGEHSFSTVLGAGRPDASDLSLADTLADRAAEKLRSREPSGPVAVRGETPPRPYYQPRDRNGVHIDIRKVKPRLGDACVRCGWCADACPMGAIDPRELSSVTGVCIKCCACVKGCPHGARYFDDPGYLYHLHELEELYAGTRREPELFL